MAKTGYTGVPTWEQLREVFGTASQLAVYTVATAPDPGPEGSVIFVSDGMGGDPTIAVSDGTDWLDTAGAAISTGA